MVTCFLNVVVARERHGYVLSGKASQKREALCAYVMSTWGNKPPEVLGLLVSSLGEGKAGKGCVISVSKGGLTGRRTMQIEVRNGWY